jgi:hypothetical protein
VKLKTLLFAQCVYAFSGIGYNVLSHLAVSSGGKAFSATAPLTGGLSLALYGLCLLPGFLGHLRVYRVLMGTAILVFGWGGIVKHLLNYPGGLDAYSSMTAYILAIGINAVGLVLNLIAVTGKYENPGPAVPG